VEVRDRPDVHGLTGLLKKSHAPSTKHAPKGLHRIAQGKRCSNLVEEQCAALGPETATHDHIARRAYIGRLFQHPLTPVATVCRPLRGLERPC